MATEFLTKNVNTLSLAMPILVHKHPLWMRLTHWLQVPLLALMVWSGLLIYWAFDPYAIRIGGFTLITFFPNWFYEALGVKSRLAEGMSWHFAGVWGYAIVGVVYTVCLLTTGRIKNLFPKPRHIGQSFLVVLHEMGLRKAVPANEGLYNAAQRLAYFTAWVLGILLVLTGIAIYKPIQLNWLAAIFGGYEFARLIHFSCTVLIVAFFVVHILQVIKAGWRVFLGVVIGSEPLASPKVDNLKGGQLIDNHLEESISNTVAPPTNNSNE
jgi:thiosulfate reductase cytochrome b subunit